MATFFRLDNSGQGGYTPGMNYGGANLNAGTTYRFDSSGQQGYNPQMNYNPVTIPQFQGSQVSGTSGGSSGGSTTTTSQPSQPSGGNSGIQTPNFDALISQINGLSDQAISALDQQRQSQEAIVNNNYGQGVNNLQFGMDQGNQLLDTSARKIGENQVKTLNDLTGNLRNMFSAGQNYLGARGAGDSSATNQYSYAISQLGNKSRGDVLSQSNSLLADVNDRRSQLLAQFNNGKQQLDTQKANQIQQIAQWFADAQNQIRQAKGQNIVALGQQALQFAMNQVAQVNANYQARQNSLLVWAENNSKNIVELQNKMKSLGMTAYQMPTAEAINGTPNGQVNSSGQWYPGANTTKKYDEWGRPIS